MNAFSRHQALSLPALSPECVRKWIEKTQDLVLLLDTSNHIAGFYQDESFDDTDLNHWIGKNLADCLSVESRPKLPPLLDNDAACDDNDARWRHINLLGFHNQVIPILAKCMSLPSDRFSKALFCRDLRPLERANNNFLIAQRELEKSNQDLRNKLEEKERVRHLNKAVDTSGVLSMIKQTTYSQAIRETVTVLERKCLQALLDEARGDHNQAAHTAGLSMVEWHEKLAFFKVR